MRFLCLIALMLNVLFGCAPQHVPTVHPVVSCPLQETDYEPDQAVSPPAVALSEPQRVAEAVPVNDTPLMSRTRQRELTGQAMERFFRPWHLAKASVPVRDAFWGIKAYRTKIGFSENLRPFPPKRWDDLIRLQAMDRYPSQAVPAITVRNVDVRVMPTMRPFFQEGPDGRPGYPFDQFQNSSLWIGSPVLITHRSTDQAWCFVETAAVFGWVRAEDLALAGEAFRTSYQSTSLEAVLVDDLPLIGAAGYMGRAHIGALFPRSSGQSGASIIVPVRDADGQARTATVALGEDLCAPVPLPMTSRNIARVADAMAGQQYGWGGLYENRDCSGTMRDLFLPFGMWLPRNSSQQAKLGGTLIPLEKKTAEQKLQILRTRGVPMLSLLWMPGHIGLYLGPDSRGEPLLLHNSWGVRTREDDGSEGRAIVGGLAITTLRPGEERPDVEKGRFLSRIKGLVLLQ